MVIARSTSETFPYVIKAERDLPQDKQTIFNLRRLPASIGLALDNLHEASSMGGSVTLRVGDQRIVTLRAGLAGWTNFHDASGAVVEFRTIAGERAVFGIVVKNPAAPEMIDYLPEEVAEELAVAIRHGNELTRDDAKNSR